MHVVVLVALFAAIVSAAPAAAQSFELALPPEPITADDCLACHSANDHAIATASSHAVRADYAQARLRMRAFLKAPDAPSGAGGTVRSDFLVNGRVECASCHVSHLLEAPGPFRLRSSNLTRLCLGCHVLP